MLRIFVAKQAFSVIIDGSPIVVSPGDTVREGHPIMVGREFFFAPQRVKFEHMPPAKKPAPKKV